jgi:hypothetical protein
VDEKNLAETKDKRIAVPMLRTKGIWAPAPKPEVTNVGMEKRKEKVVVLRELQRAIIYTIELSKRVTEGHVSTAFIVYSVDEGARLTTKKEDVDVWCTPYETASDIPEVWYTPRERDCIVQ